MFYTIPYPCNGGIPCLPTRGCSKSPVKMTHRISSLACFSAAQSYAASIFSILFNVHFEHALLMFRKPLVSPFGFYSRTEFTAAPALCNASTKLTSLTHRFYMLYLIILEYKKTSIRKKDEELVVPPLLAEKTAHFGNMKWVFHIISGNDETVRQSLL